MSETLGDISASLRFGIPAQLASGWINLCSPLRQTSQPYASIAFRRLIELGLVVQLEAQMDKNSTRQPLPIVALKTTLSVAS